MTKGSGEEGKSWAFLAVRWLRIQLATQATPDAKHLLGTTVGGLDVLSRVIWGSRTALYTILVSVVASLFLGTFLGLISG